MMRNRFWPVWLIMILLASLWLAGCSSEPPPATQQPTAPPTLTPLPTAAPSPTPGPTEEAGSAAPALAGAGQVAVAVNGIPLTSADLQSLEQVTIQVYQPDREYTGVRIKDLLALVEAEGDLVITAYDGYQATIAAADITDNALLAYDTGGLRAVFPEIPTSNWVKGVIDIQVISPTPAVSQAAPTAAVAAEGEFALTVTDALGREVALTRPPQQIAAAGRGTFMVAGALFMFPEARERVVALEGGRLNDPAAFLPLVDPTFSDKTILERNAGPEQIAPVQPDAVILKTLAQDLGESLETLGFPVIYVDLEQPEQYFDDVTTLGQLFNNEARAQEIIAYFQARLDRIETALAGLEDSARPGVLTLQYSSQGGAEAFEVPSAAWLQTKQVELAGGRPVWVEAAEAGGWTLVNFEQIALWNPDKIFIIVYQDDSLTVIEDLKANPQWQALTAVQNDEIYGFPSDIFGWDSPDPRWILGVVWLSHKIYPDRLAEVDIIQEVYDFFEQIYGLDEATVTEHILPQLKGDIP